MNVEILRRNDPERPDTDPLPEANGLVWRVYRGDYCDPLFGNWFAAPWPRVLVTLQLPFMPFVAWKLGRWRGYVGFKLYGVDAEAYRAWLPDRHVYKGSRACCFSARPLSFSAD